MCTWMPTGTRPRRARHVAHQRARQRDRHAELVVAQAGRDVRMAAGVDVGIDAQRHAHARGRGPTASWSRRSSSPGDSTLMACTSSVDGAGQLRRRLAHAGEDDVARRRSRSAAPRRPRPSSWRRRGCRACASAAPGPAWSWPSARSGWHAGARRRRCRGAGRRRGWRRRCRRSSACRGPPPPPRRPPTRRENRPGCAAGRPDSRQGPAMIP